MIINTHTHTLLRKLELEGNILNLIENVDKKNYSSSGNEHIIEYTDVILQTCTPEI